MNIVSCMISTSTRHVELPEICREEAKERMLRRLFRSETSWMGDMEKEGCWWRTAWKRGSMAAAGERGLGRVRLSLLSCAGRLGVESLVGRPTFVWLTLLKYDELERAGKCTWDIDSWMIDVFPAIRRDGLVVLDRNGILNFLLGRRSINVDLCHESCRSVQHSLVSSFLSPGWSTCR